MDRENTFLSVRKRPLCMEEHISQAGMHRRLDASLLFAIQERPSLAPGTKSVRTSMRSECMLEVLARKPHMHYLRFLTHSGVRLRDDVLHCGCWSAVRGRDGCGFVPSDASEAMNGGSFCCILSGYIFCTSSVLQA